MIVYIFLYNDNPLSWKCLSHAFFILYKYKYRKVRVHHERHTALFFGSNRTGFNIYSLHPCLSFVAAWVVYACLSLSNCSLNHSAMGFRSMARPI